MTPEVALAGVILVSLTLYAVTGGADFGGGVWDLLARGPRAQEQRRAIAHAIGPIWEANHVWLILVVVLMFIGFPPAFVAMSTALHIPFTILLIGIVLRGSSFVFRKYDDQDVATRTRWSRVFAVSSTASPVMLGVSVGAIVSGKLAIDPETDRVVLDFFGSWLAPLPFAIGLFALALFAWLAAVYLTNETEGEVQEDFRRKALGAWFVAGVLAFVCLGLSLQGAPVVWAGLATQPWSLPFQLLVGLLAFGAGGAMWTRRYAVARWLAASHVATVVVGWGAAQYPYLIPPDLTVHNAAAPADVLVPVLAVVGTGAVLLVPSYLYLFKVFKAEAD